MGKGDRKSKKGKTFKGSYGNSRKHRTNKIKHKAPTPSSKKK